MRSCFNRLQQSHKGVAMLLVIVCLMTATITTTAYLSSRDNSTAIGENGVATTESRWAADSGLDLGVAMLETRADWRTYAQSNGNTLLRNYVMGDSTIDVMVCEYGTGAAVGPNSEHIQVTSIGRTNGMEQTVVANAFVPLKPGVFADVDLSEFAVFAADGLSMSERAIIARWPRAPLSGLGERVQIGTQATGASSIQLLNSAAAIDATVFHSPGASGALVSNADGPALVTVELPDEVPLPSPPPHGELAPTLPASDLTMSGGTATVLTSARYQRAELKNGAVRTLKGNINLVTNEDLRINSGAKLVIDGSVKIVVFGNLELDMGSIELKSGARLRVYARGQDDSTAVLIKDGYIGGLRADNTRDSSGTASWIDPQRVTIFSDTPTRGGCEWRIENQSVVQGSLYAPHTSIVAVRNTSAVYGRIAANTVTMREDAAVFYDPALDIRCGYSNTESAIYDNNGDMKTEYKTIGSLDAVSLQLIANTTNTIIKSDAGTKQTLTGISVIQPVFEPAPESEPTPRPIKVECTMVSFGTGVHSWE